MVHPFPKVSDTNVSWKYHDNSVLAFRGYFSPGLVSQQKEKCAK
jgi:hypothetical protein